MVGTKRHLTCFYYIETSETMTSLIREIIRNYFRNDQPKRVKAAFATWIKENSNKKKWEEKEVVLAEIWNELDIQADESTELSFNKLLAAIRSEESQGAGSGRKKSTLFSRRLSRVAAIFILPLLSVGITYWIVKGPVEIDSRLDLVECIVPYGEIRTITLPDSSVVKVNSGSILIYPGKFTTVRDVFLNGEAYFSVTGDETRPFIVKTSDMDVEVKGTVFNVSAYTDSENLAATLERGSVNVTFRNRSDAPVLLAPGERISIDRKSGQIEKEVVRVKDVIAWTEGNMVIQGMSINEVARCIERRYNIKVYLNSNKYEHERITVKLKSDETVSDLMKVLKIIVPRFSYKIEEDKLFIY